MIVGSMLSPSIVMVSMLSLSMVSISALAESGITEFHVHANACDQLLDSTKRLESDRRVNVPPNELEIEPQIRLEQSEPLTHSRHFSDIQVLSENQIASEAPNDTINGKIEKLAQILEERARALARAQVSNDNPPISRTKKEEEELHKATQQLLNSMRRVARTYDIVFYEPKTVNSSNGYAARMRNGKFTVAIPDQLYTDPIKSLEEFRRFTKTLYLQNRLVEAGLSIWPRELNASTRLRVLGKKQPAEKQSAQKQPSQKDLAHKENEKNKNANTGFAWILERYRRHGIEVYIGSPQDFSNETSRASAYAKDLAVVIRRELFEDLMNGKINPLLAHELNHAVNVVKCRKYFDCARLINFKSEDFDLIAQTPITENSQASTPGEDSLNTLPRSLYANYFRSDEVESYRLSADPRLQAPLELQLDALYQALKFAQLQIYYLDMAIAKLQGPAKLQESTLHQNAEIKEVDSFRVIEIFPEGKKVEVRMVRHTFLNEEMARKYYHDLLTTRLNQIKLQEQIISKRLLPTFIKMLQIDFEMVGKSHQ
jgi:hypothetical protein